MYLDNHTKMFSDILEIDNDLRGDALLYIAAVEGVFYGWAIAISSGTVYRSILPWLYVILSLYTITIIVYAFL